VSQTWSNVNDFVELLFTLIVICELATDSIDGSPPRVDWGRILTATLTLDLVMATYCTDMELCTRKKILKWNWNTQPFWILIAESTTLLTHVF
jgi:hypothetical protein